MDDVSANTEVNKATGKLPSTARVVVIGGGSVGASVLYHLAEKGWTDVVLLEKNELTSGSTWHAAGNCPNFVGSWTMMKIQSYSTNLYRKLGDLVAYPMNYHVTGAIRLAHSRQRMEEFRHVERMGRHMGIEFEEMSNAEMKDIYPFLETHDLYGGQWDSLDGDIDPAQLTQAFAKGARKRLQSRRKRHVRPIGRRPPSGLSLKMMLVMNNRSARGLDSQEWRISISRWTSSSPRS